MTTKEPNQGEGDKVSAERYNRDVRDFVAKGRVEPAAREAAQYVSSHPDEAMREERAAKRGPIGWLERTLAGVRAVLHRK